MIENKWVWYGNTGHFCASRDCEFHLCTEVGEYLVSTVGEYYPDKKQSMQPLGLAENSFYEVSVFKWNGRCKCGCGLPKINPSALEQSRYETPKEANEEHLKMCLKYDSLGGTVRDDE